MNKSSPGKLSHLSPLCCAYSTFLHPFPIHSPGSTPSISHRANAATPSAAPAPNAHGPLVTLAAAPAVVLTAVADVVNAADMLDADAGTVTARVLDSGVVLAAGAVSTNMRKRARNFVAFELKTRPAVCMR